MQKKWIDILHWYNFNVDYQWPFRWKQLSLGWLCFLFSCFIEFFYTCGVYLHQNGDGFSTRRYWKHWHQENVSKGQFCYFVTCGLRHFNIPYWLHISCLFSYIFTERLKILLSLSVSLSVCTLADFWYVNNM